MSGDAVSGRRAAVVGAGIGGLTAALCLQARGWDVTVLERSESLREIGAGLQVPPNAMRVFARLGFDARLREVGVAPRALEAATAGGRELFSIALAGEPYGAPYLHVHRADFVKCLAEALEARAPGSITLGVEVEGVRQDAERVYVAGREADLLVAADGIRSGIRTRMFDPAPPRWTGNVAWRATVLANRLDDPPPATARVWMGARCHAVTYRLRGGDLVNFVGVVEQEGWREEGWNIPGKREAALEAFGAFSSVVTDVLRASDTLHRWALFDRAPIEDWVAGRVALLGDAAHPMLPFMAQGAAMAVEDAWVLADAVTGMGVEAGLEAYQARRRARATRVQAASRRNARLFHLSGPERAVAHTALRAVNTLAPGLIRRRFDWLYGFDPTA